MKKVEQRKKSVFEQMLEVVSPSVGIDWDQQPVCD